MSINQKYKVYIRDYTDRHYIKVFDKKYGRHWDLTLEAIIASLEHVDTFLGTSKAEKIISCHEENKHLIKCEFRVVWTTDSAHASGNRYIVYLDEVTRECHILLVYSKWDYSGQETTWWKLQIKENYPELKDIFSSL